MLWTTVWTVLVVAALCLHGALIVRLWRTGKAAAQEVSRAAQRFSDTSEAVRKTFAERRPPAATPLPLLGDPRALKRQRDKRLRQARTARARRLDAVRVRPLPPTRTAASTTPEPTAH